MKKDFRIPPILGVLGFLGILGFFFEPFFCVFFGFFGFFFWGLLQKEQVDERLEQNIAKAMAFSGRLSIMLCFFLLLALEKNVPADTVLLFGSIAYAAIFTLAPAMAFVIDRRG